MSRSKDNLSRKGANESVGDSGKGLFEGVFGGDVLPDPNSIVR